MYEQEVQGRLPQSSSASSEISLRTQTLYLSALPFRLLTFHSHLVISRLQFCCHNSVHYIPHLWMKERRYAAKPFFCFCSFYLKSNFHPLPPHRGPLEDFLLYHIDQNWTTQLAQTITKVRKRNIWLSILYISKKNRNGSSFLNLTIIILKFTLMTHVYIIHKVLVILVNYSWVQDLQEPWFRISSFFWWKKKGWECWWRKH